MQELKKIIELVSKKCDLDISRDEQDFITPYWLLDAIVKETQEVLSVRMYNERGRNAKENRK